MTEFAIQAVTMGNSVPLLTQRPSVSASLLGHLFAPDHGGSALVSAKMPPLLILGFHSGAEGLAAPVGWGLPRTFQGRPGRIFQLAPLAQIPTLVLESVSSRRNVRFCALSALFPGRFRALQALPGPWTPPQSPAWPRRSLGSRRQIPVPANDVPGLDRLSSITKPQMIHSRPAARPRFMACRHETQVNIQGLAGHVGRRPPFSGPPFLPSLRLGARGRHLPGCVFHGVRAHRGHPVVAFAQLVGNPALAPSGVGLPHHDHFGSNARRRLMVRFEHDCSLSSAA